LPTTSESVLVVDDEQISRTILVKIVQREGYEADEAADGVEALSKLKARQFDYVISDIKMPNMDGMQLLKEVKTNHPSVSVLLVTGQSPTINPREAIAAGAESLILKPFKNVEIARTLAKLSNIRRRTGRRAPHPRTQSPGTSNPPEQV